MADWPKSSALLPTPIVIAPCDSQRSPAYDFNICTITALATGLWPAANRAIYVPFLVTEIVTAFLLAFNVGTSSGNYDAGIYDVNGVRLVSLGSTAMPAAGLVSANIGDTVLRPGNYFAALCVDNTTATVTRGAVGTVGSLTVNGVQDQDVGAVTLPDPATFSAPGAVYVPAISVFVRTATL